MPRAEASEPIPAAGRRVLSYGMPHLPIQQAHSRDGQQLPAKSETWYSGRKPLCSPHEFYRQYSEAGSASRSSKDKSARNRAEYPQVSSVEEHIPSLNASATPVSTSYNSFVVSLSLVPLSDRWFDNYISGRPSLFLAHTSYLFPAYTFTTKSAAILL